ncbi:unnamed protein product [Urochloa humidicola]
MEKGSWGYEYKGRKDRSRAGPEDLSEEEVLSRVRSMLPRVTERPAMPELYSADRLLRAEDVDYFYSWPKIREKEARGDGQPLVDLLPKTSDVLRRKRKLQKKKSFVDSEARTSASPVGDFELV